MLELEFITSFNVIDDDELNKRITSFKCLALH